MQVEGKRISLLYTVCSTDTEAQKHTVLSTYRKGTVMTYSPATAIQPQ